MKITKLHFTLAVTFVSLPLVVNGAPKQNNDYYTGYEGVVLGERTPRSATDAITKQATQIPGDIYRGTVFGAEQKEYRGDVLGNRPRAKSKLVYDTSLIRAIKINDTDRVRTLLYANVNVNEKNYAGITPMTVAAEKGNMDIIRLLVENGKADINAKSSYGVTPLIAATAAGQAEVVQYLIKHGADSTAKDDLGKTALTYASNFDNAKTLSDLIALDKTSLNIPDNAGNTPLIYSAQRGYLANVKTLLSNGANVNYRNPASGLSALSAAAAEGYLPVVKWLVKNGKADVNLPDLSGRTPIFYAVENDKPEVLQFLLANGADVNSKDHTGVTALMRASAKDRQACQKILLNQKNIDVNAQDNLGRSVVTYSIYASELEPIKELVAAKADINIPDAQGNTPLMNAIKAKNDRASVFLIQQGALLTAVNNTGDTAFTLTPQFLPDSATSRVLGVKQATVEQQALQAEAEKLAALQALEQQLIEEENTVSQLQAEKAAELTQQAAEKEAEVRAQVTQEYQDKTALLDNDPEIQRLQQQLENAKAQKAAALQAEIDQRVDEQMGRATAVKQQAQAQVKQTQAAVNQQAAQANKQAAKAQNTARKKQTAVKQQANKTAGKIKGEYIPKSSIAPKEVSMADLLNQ